MRMADKPERIPADLGTNDPTFVYRNEINRLKQDLVDAKAMIKHQQDRAEAYRAALELGGERTAALENALRPFADSVPRLNKHIGDEQRLAFFGLTFGDLRRAAALLEKS